MRKLGLIILIVLALLAAITATGMVTLYLKKQEKLATAGPALRPVVVSVADLSFGKTLEGRDLQVAMFPEASVPKGAVSLVDSLIGQTTKVFLAQNEPVLVSKLSSIGGGLSLRIEPTMRAASVQVDKVSGVSGFVLPGDRVDVIAIVPPSDQTSEAIARTILQSIEVLASGQKTEQKEKSQDPATVQSVTLLVDPAGAEALALAANLGKIHLALRNPNDVSITASEDNLTRSDLLGEKKKEAAPRPAAPKSQPMVVKEKPPTPPPRADSLTIIRGADARKQRPAMETPTQRDTAGRQPG